MPNFDKNSYNFERLVLTSPLIDEEIDLSGFVHSMVIKQSIFENTMMGALSLIDGIGLSIGIPIIGQETIEISFVAQPGQTPFTQKFRVYALEDYKTNNGMVGASYVLKFVSQEFIICESTRINRSYKRRLVSQIAQDVYDNFIADSANRKSVEIESTVNTQLFTIANKNPLQTMNLLCAYAQSATQPNNFFVFYENTTGFHFKSLGSLYTKDPVEEYFDAIENVDIKSERGAPESDVRVESIAHKQGFNYLDAVARGMLSNRVDSLDLLTHTYRTNTFDYQAQFGELPHIESPNPQPVVPREDTTQSQYYRLINSRTHRSDSAYFRGRDADIDTFSKDFENSLPGRIAMFQQLNYIQVAVTVGGNTSLKAGDVITLNISARSASQTSAEEPHKYITGRFIIKSLAHELEGETFVTKLSLCKDSFAAPIIPI